MPQHTGAKPNAYSPSEDCTWHPFRLLLSKQRRLEGQRTPCGRKDLRLRLYEIHKNLTEKLLKNDAPNRIGGAKQAEALLDLIDQL